MSGEFKITADSDVKAGLFTLAGMALEEFNGLAAGMGGRMITRPGPQVEIRGGNIFISVTAMLPVSALSEYTGRQDRHELSRPPQEPGWLGKPLAELLKAEG